MLCVLTGLICALLIGSVLVLFRIKHFQARKALRNIERLLEMYRRQDNAGLPAFRKAEEHVAEARFNYENDDADECMNQCAAAHMELDTIDEIPE